MERRIEDRSKGRGRVGKEVLESQKRHKINVGQWMTLKQNQKRIGTNKGL